MELEKVIMVIFGVAIGICIAIPIALFLTDGFGSKGVVFVYDKEGRLAGVFKQ